MTNKEKYELELLRLKRIYGVLNSEKQLDRMLHLEYLENEAERLNQIIVRFFDSLPDEDDAKSPQN